MNASLAKPLIAQADAAALPLADRSVALCIGSPPYCDARTYGIDAQRGCREWIDWMLQVTAEAQRVTVGPVIWVAAGVTRDRNYWPACEGLMYRWWDQGGDCHLYRPCYWNRVGIPGSGGRDWFRADVEYVMCFKRPGPLPWADPTANGHPPKWAPGGEMANRLSDGTRVNQWGHPIDSGGTVGGKDDVTCGKPRPSHRQAVWGGGGTSFGRKANGEKILPAGSKLITRRDKAGTRDRKIVSDPNKARQSIESTYYTEPVLANPGNFISIEHDDNEVANVIKCIVGGGVMGHPLAHESEAPYPVALAAWLIRALAPPGSYVLDPFNGSGTTCDAAWREGRVGIGFDLRMNQCQIARWRLAKPMMKRKKKENGPEHESLFATIGGAA